MVKFGYNVDTASLSLDKALTSMKASGADAHLIMIANGDYFIKAGDLDTIRKYAAALPDATIIVRLYHASEGNWASYPPAAQYENNWRWVKQQLGMEVMKRIVFDSPFNEPNLAGDNPTEATKFVDCCRALVKAASNAGVKLAIGAFSVGTPHESLLRTAYVPLWRDLAQYKQGISVHAYGAAIPELGEIQPLSMALDPVASRSAITKTRWPLEHGGWLIARPYRIIKIFEELGLGVPEIYVTEGIVDNIFNSSNSDIKEAWRSKFGIDMFQRDPRGIQTWERWLLEVFKQDRFDFGQCLQFLFRHARQHIFYHPAFKAVCIFALNAQWGYGYDGKPDGTNKHAGSNFDRPEFTKFRMDYLPVINAEPLGDVTPVPIPTPEPVKYPLFSASVSSSVGSNIRALPTKYGTDIGDISITPTACLIAKEGIVIDGLTWLEIEYKGIKGYVAKTANLVITYTEVIPPPPPVMVKKYPLEFNGATMLVDEETLNTFIEYYELQAAALKTIVPILVAA